MLCQYCGLANPVELERCRRCGQKLLIVSGVPRTEIEPDDDALFEAQEQIVVGLNQYTVEVEPPIEVLKVDPAIEAGQRERLAALRARRDDERVGHRAQLAPAAVGHVVGVGNHESDVVGRAALGRGVVRHGPGLAP